MKLTTKSRSYIGQTIDVSIDVHKCTYSGITRVKQTAVKRWATAAEPEKLAQQLNKIVSRRSAS